MGNGYLQLVLVKNAKFGRQDPIIVVEGNSKVFYLTGDGNYQNQANAGSNNEGMGNGYFNWVGSYYADNYRNSILQIR